MNNVSDRLNTVPASPIRKLVPYALAAKKRGVKIYHLNIGDPDIKTPQVMLDVLRGWRENPIAYGQSQGQPELLETVKNYYHQLGYGFIKTNDIQITSGGSEAISYAMFAVANPQDEIITFEPLYANYNSYAAVNNVTLIPVLTKPENGFHLPKKTEIVKKITKKTRAILYCNPNNPTGTVYDRQEIEILVEIAKKYGLFLIADEVYREFTYDGKKQTSLLSYLKKIPQQAILLDSLSKRYSLCGARLGMLVSLNKEIMAGVLRIAQGRLSAGFIDQKMAAKLTLVPRKYFENVHKEYEKRRNALYEGLMNIPGIFLKKPEGAFYAVVKLPVKNAEDFCRWLLTDFPSTPLLTGRPAETVMLAPASGFYATSGKGLDEVRIAYVLNIPSLKKAIKILKIALHNYSLLS